MTASHYKCILAAVDLNPTSDDATITKALTMAKANNAKLYLVHAIESPNMYGSGFGYPSLNNVEHEISVEHKEMLLKEMKKYHLDPEHLIIGIGSVRDIVIDNAKTLNADLIIVGLHTRHGLGLLLGVTAKEILADAPCDVLAVKLNDD